MTHGDAVAIIQSFLTDTEKAIVEQDLAALVKIVEERSQLLWGAGQTLAQHIDATLAEQIDGPFTKLLQGIWLYVRASLASNAVNAIIQDVNAHHQALAAQAEQAAKDPAFAALADVAEETLGNHKKK